MIQMPCGIVRKAAAARIARVVDEPDMTKRIILRVGDEAVRNLYDAATWLTDRWQQGERIGEPLIAVSTEDFALLRNYL